MGEKTSRVYKQARKDETFREEFSSIKGNRFPMFADSVEKAVIAAFYCGWLVGRHGPALAEEMYQNI